MTLQKLLHSTVKRNMTSRVGPWYRSSSANCHGCPQIAWAVLRIACLGGLTDRLSVTYLLSMGALTDRWQSPGGLEDRCSVSVPLRSRACVAMSLRFLQPCDVVFAMADLKAAGMPPLMAAIDNLVLQEK